MNTGTRVQILDEAAYISHSANTLGKVWIQLFSLQLWVNSEADKYGNFGMATGLGEGNNWIQTC